MIAIISHSKKKVGGNPIQGTLTYCDTLWLYDGDPLQSGRNNDLPQISP